MNRYFLTVRKKKKKKIKKNLIPRILAFHYAFRLRVEQLTYYTLLLLGFFFIIPSKSSTYIRRAANILWKCKLFSLRPRIIMVRWKYRVSLFPLSVVFYFARKVEGPKISPRRARKRSKNTPPRVLDERSCATDRFDRNRKEAKTTRLARANAARWYLYENQTA